MRGFIIFPLLVFLLGASVGAGVALSATGYRHRHVMPTTAGF